MNKKLFIVIFYFFTSSTNAICFLDFRFPLTVSHFKNQLFQNQLSKSNILIIFSAIILLLSIGIIFLLNRNYKNNKKIHELNILQSKKELPKEYKKTEWVTILNDKEEDKWLPFIEKNQLETAAINLKSLDPNRGYQQVLNAYSNPCYFLLDREGKVILKSFNNKAILEIINR